MSLSTKNKIFVALAGIGAFGLVGVCGWYEFPQKPVSVETHVDEFSLFDGAVNLKKIEKDGNFRWNGNLVLSLDYQFTFNQPGDYLFEGWASRYRANDEKVEDWKFDINQVPIVQTKNSKNFLYRLEGTRVVDNKIKRSTTNLKNYGSLPSGLYGVGHQQP